MAESNITQTINNLEKRIERIEMNERKRKIIHQLYDEQLTNMCRLTP